MQGLRRCGSVVELAARLEQRLEAAEHQLQLPPGPPASSSPPTIAASLGACSSSWMSVSFVTPPSPGSISWVSRVKPSVAMYTR